MPDQLAAKQAKLLATLEVSLLRRLGVVPESFENGRVGSASPVYDINGKLLFFRLPITRGKLRDSFVDIAAESSAFGALLIAVSQGVIWDEKAILSEAAAAAKRQKVRQYDAMRFVAFSFPKIAVQFLLEGKEVAMLEWMTWAPVPQARNLRERKPLEPENFERWSLLEETPAARKRANVKRYGERMAIWNDRRFRDLTTAVVSSSLLDKLVAIELVDSREIHYSSRDTDHVPCYELRGQQTDVWCVGASVQMVLDFYRYEYTQVRLAQELGLGTLANPNGLPYANVGLVVTRMESLTSNALNVTMITNPTFSTFRNEIRANRPVISFIPGHSRTVAGYTRSLFKLINSTGYRGLLVYDPWPPNAGVITRWENVDAQTYQYAYTSQVTLV